MPSDPSADVAVTALTPEDVLRALQRGVDLVKADDTRPVALGDALADDLDLDSLDAVDVLGIAEADLPPGVIDVVIDRLPDLRTVGEVVDAVLAAAATAGP